MDACRRAGGSDLDRRGDAGHQLHPLRNGIDVNFNRDTLCQPHPGEDRIDRGDAQLIGLRVWHVDRASDALHMPGDHRGITEQLEIMTWISLGHLYIWLDVGEFASKEFAFTSNCTMAESLNWTWRGTFRACAAKGDKAIVKEMTGRGLIGRDIAISLR